MEGETLPLISAGITLVAFVVQIVGFASPYWFKCKEGHGGLWLNCEVNPCVGYRYGVADEDIGIKTASKLAGGALGGIADAINTAGKLAIGGLGGFTDVINTASGLGGNKGLGGLADRLKNAAEKIEGPVAQDGQIGAAAMECLAFILFLVAIVCIVLKQFVMKDKKILYTIMGVANIIAGVFGLIGVVIYGTLDFPKHGRECRFNFSFAFCLIASIAALFGGVLFIVGRNK